MLGLKKDQFIHLKFESRYLKTNAFNLAILSAAAYMNRTDVEDFLFNRNKLENRAVQSIEAGNVQSCFLFESIGNPETIRLTYDLEDEASTGTQFFHFETEEYLLFSFRGTEFTLKDALSDLNAEMVSFSECVGKVHAGFYNAFKSIQHKLDKIVERAHGKDIILCGHSLGGALATLAATYIRKKFKREVMLYTFGSPLVGDIDLTYHFTKVEPIIYYRIVHNQDLVTMVPPPHSHLRINLLVLALVDPIYLIPATIDPFGKPFNHLGKMVFIRRIGGDAFSVDVDRKTPAYIRIPSNIPVMEDRPRWDSITNWANVSIGDHLMKNYISILGSDLKFSIESYLSANAVTVENSKKILEYLEAELKAIRESHAELEKKMMMPVGGIAFTDATSTGSTPADKQSPAQKMNLLEEALQNKQMELIMQKGTLTAARTPGYAQSILHEIIDLKMSPTLKREFEYQKRNIMY